MQRRTFLSCGVGGSLAAMLATGGSVRAQQHEAKQPRRQSFAPPRYRVIYNWDGAPFGYSDFPQSLDQFLDKTFAPLKDTQVGALFWCVGEHEAAWNSQSLPIVGDSLRRVYGSARSMRYNENIRAMIERGENPWSSGVTSWESTSTCRSG